MEHPTWIGRTLGNRYRIDKLLGQGGMSAVYKATDPNLKREVAIKLIHEHLSTDASFVHRFESEAAAVASLRHPNIVQVFDFNHDDDVYYMVLEFIAGETLQDRLKRLADQKEQLPLEDAIKITIQVAEAVGYAHQHGMVHRDIKPANIMLAQQQAILMDFGIVKILGGERHTSTGAVVGTVRYMSPEIIQGEEADSRSDIYSLGVTFYEMISGRPPFVADSAMTLMMMHINNPVPDVRDYRSGVQPALVDVLARCLAKDRADRYQTAEELAADLRQVLMDAPASGVIARRPATQPPAPVSPAAPSPTTLPARSVTVRSLLIGFAAVFVIALGIWGLLRPGAMPDVPTSTPTLPAPAPTLPPSDEPPPPTQSQAAAALPSLTLTPTVIPTKTYPAQIAYMVKESDKVRSIHVADADGQNSRALPVNDCLNTDPNWSKDGTYIIYQSNCFGSYDIRRINPDGTNKGVIVGDSNFDEREASISPDGEQVLYVRWLKGQDYNQNGDIRILTFSGSDISSGLEGRAPEFSPDGTRIAYMSYDGSLWQIFVYDLVTRQKVQITNDNVDHRWPAWSPDGTEIAYNSALGGGITVTGIWIIPATGGDARQILRGNYGRPSWSDTGWILFNSDDGLGIVRPDGTGLEQLTEDNGQAGVWSR